MLLANNVVIVNGSTCKGQSGVTVYTENMLSGVCKVCSVTKYPLFNASNLHICQLGMLTFRIEFTSVYEGLIG